MIRSRVAAAIMAGALALTLAGCAAATPTPTHTHRVAQRTPTSTSTDRAASSPGSRVPLGCADLLGANSWQSIAGEAATVEQDEDTAPTNLTSIAQLQYGALSCVWDGTRASSASRPGSHLIVTVAPDAKNAFEGRFTAIMADQSFNPHGAATQNVAGDQSGYWCGTTLDALGADVDIPDCDAEMLVGDYWVSIDVDDIDGLTRPQVTAALTAAMTEVAAKLTSAGAAPKQWVAPATAPPAFCGDPTSTAKVRAIFGNATLAALNVPALSTYASNIGRVGTAARCSWTSRSYGSVDVDLLAGGSWAFPAISPIETGDSDLARHAFVPMTVAGASTAKVVCVDGACGAYLAVGTTAVDVGFENPGAANVPAVLAAFAKAIATS